jgi:hypothetical protein
VGDDHKTTWSEHPESFRCRRRSVEPLPALPAVTTSNASAGEFVKPLRPSDHVMYGDASLRIKRTGFRQKRLGRVERGDLRSSERETAGDRARTCAEVEDALTLSANAEGRETLEEPRWETGAVAAVVGRRAPEIDPCGEGSGCSDVNGIARHHLD